MKQWIYEHRCGLTVAWLAAIILLPFLGIAPLTDPNEPVYGQTAKEMLLAGDWLSPRIYGQFWYDKPPLFYWMEMLSYSLFGISDWSSRLPSAVAAVATALFVYVQGKDLFNQAIAFMATLILLTSVLYVAFVLLGPVLYGEAIDAMLGAGQVDFSTVYFMTAGFALCVLLAFLSQKIQGDLVNVLCYRIVRDLRRDAFYSLTAARVRYIDTHAQGDVIARVVNDVDIVSDGLLQGVSQLFTGVMTILATLVVMFVINYVIALVVVVLTPLSLFAAAFITKRTFKSFSRQVRVQGKLAAHAKEMIGGQKTVLLFGQEENSCKKFEEIDAHLYEIGWRAQYFSALTNPSTRFVNAVIYAFVGVLGALFCILSTGGELTLGVLTLSGFTPGMLSVFLSYANQYTKPFNEVSNVVTQMQNAFASAERVFAVVDEPGEELAGSKHIGKVRGDICFEDVTFSYSPEQELIEHLNVRRSSTCSCAFTSCAAGASRWTASTCATSPSTSTAVCSAWCCKRASSRRKRSPGTSPTATRARRARRWRQPPRPPTATSSSATCPRATTPCSRAVSASRRASGSCCVSRASCSPTRPCSSSTRRPATSIP